MFTHHFERRFAYNNWAWDAVFASLEKLDEAEYLAERPFFWKSLHEVTVHCLSAEYVWLNRCLGQYVTMFDPAGLPNFPAVKERWLPVRADFTTFLNGLSEADYQNRMVDYRNSRGNGFALSLPDLLTHVLNHATEHRSQMTPVLHNLGVPTAGLDYMRFALFQ